MPTICNCGVDVGDGKGLHLPPLSVGATPSAMAANGCRHHFRQFCHCHCTCIHKCHHEQQPDWELNDNRPSSPRMDGSPPTRAPQQRRSLARVVAEMESGTLSSDSLSSLPMNTENDPSATLTSTAGKRRMQLSDFIIERDLGEGAYAFVKQVKFRHHTDGPSLVMKIIIKSKLAPECILHDFETGLSLPVEMYALRHLRDHFHPNIVSIVDAFEDALHYYLLMPMHGRGEDLFEMIERHEEFIPFERVEQIFAQLAMAVAHLHLVLGLVHRDIKDENIIIDDRDYAQLIDFGSCAYFTAPNKAKVDSDADSNAPSTPSMEIPLTEADIRCGKRQSKYHTFYGTIDYAPPEVVRGEPFRGPPQDIWALGILLYTLSFKEVPFRSISDILEGRLRLPFEPSPEIASWIRRLLHPDPQLRPTATQLVEDPWILANYQKMTDIL